MKKNISKLLSLILCMMLVAVMALTTVGCGNKTESGSAAPLKDGATIGDGAVSFSLEVVDEEAKSVKATIKTDASTVGEALLDLGIIDGEDSEYGLFVTTVNGKTLDYEKDGKYWAFYINDEYAATGVDTTEVAEGTSYKFAAE